MKIIVCVKQIPGIDKVVINSEQGTMIRESMNSTLNPFCECALDQAVRIKSFNTLAEIIVITMGPPQAEAVLTRCLELGADQGILISDRKLAGADTLVTALTLSAAIRRYAADYRLVLVGKKTMDGDTAQVGPAIAEILGLPQILNGIDISFSPDAEKIQVLRENETCIELIEACLPALVSVSTGSAYRRMPSLTDFLGVQNKRILKISASELGVRESELGLTGSFTRVVKVFEAENESNCRRVSGSDPDKAAKEIVAFIKSEN